MTLASTGPANIQRNKALGFCNKPTAPPSPFTILLFCLCAWSIAIAENGRFVCAQQSLLERTGLLHQGVFHAMSSCHEITNMNRHPSRIVSVVQCKKTMVSALIGQRHRARSRARSGIHIETWQYTKTRSSSCTTINQYWNCGEASTRFMHQSSKGIGSLVCIIGLVYEYRQCTCANLVCMSCSFYVGRLEEWFSRSCCCNICLCESVCPSTAIQKISKCRQGSHFYVQASQKNDTLLLSIHIWPVPLDQLSNREQWLV